jgi:hypothetical protein
MITHQQAARPANGVILMTADRQDHTHPQDIVAERELSSEQILERVILYALEEGTEKLEQSGAFDPFTILIKGEELFVEEHLGENKEQSYASARRTVYQMERLCDAYVFCYDGYVTFDDGTNDALVIECANKGDEKAQVITKFYHLHDDHYHFDETLYQVGEAETLFGDATTQKEPDDVGSADSEDSTSSEDGANGVSSASSADDMDDANGTSSADSEDGASDVAIASNTSNTSSASSKDATTPTATSADESAI